ncbi:hypothetical protein FRC04_002205 [Tulasnella sp. 424]|nr:hypothetical protein FRC04_002205 [Tulasnella sp. 424]KAG8967751.1 hypothetical protein FRC05_001930 [Tulasnella sp. 425]
MDTLPTELLSQIFSLLLPIPPCDSKPKVFERFRTASLTSLRLVSREWNQVILYTPELWTYIEINSKSARVDPYLSRSGNSLLHIRVALDAKTIDQPRIQKALTMVFGCTERWKTYSLRDVRTPDEVSLDSKPLFNLIPSQPLPALRAASIAIPFESASGITLKAPLLIELNTWTQQDIHLTESPLLKCWTIRALSEAANWIGTIRTLLACPQLEKLSIAWEIDSNAAFSEETMPETIVLPALQELELRDTPANQRLLARLGAPQLQTLILSHYSSPVPFTLPQSTLSLATIKFTNKPRLNAVRRAVAAMPMVQKMTVEIDASSAHLPHHAARTAFEQLKSDRSWLERHATVVWIDQQSVPSYLFQTWEEAHGLVPL